MTGRYQKIPRINLAQTGLRFSEAILDVGHNPQCVQRVFERLRQEFGGDRGKKLVTIFGCKKTKDFAEVNKLLAELSDSVYFVRPINSKG